ncbi:fasciclin domain-containing protein [Azospirillum sp. SYSU D00513]|uniref:fasciclin domain-containing protein n=1 Tax=Azospirillum sp. SYSU D00513 TaxID=2812561 RepID=UPI001FFEB208|nr:fasciclin domain-containing protein [Azospirillum sp. SYSU D00513]
MTSFTKVLLPVVAAALLAACAQQDTMPASSSGSMTSSTAMTDSAVLVGGQPMLPTRTIVGNAVNSADHTTLVAAVKAAGLADTLQGTGPFTVFAPTNAAFDELPRGTVDTLVKPANKAALTKILTYHVVPGRLDAAALKQQIRAGNGQAALTTASGGTLMARMNGPTNIIIQDAKGGMADIATYDVYQSNGVIHVVDRVLMP